MGRQTQSLYNALQEHDILHLLLVPADDNGGAALHEARLSGGTAWDHNTARKYVTVLLQC